MLIYKRGDMSLIILYTLCASSFMLAMAQDIDIVELQPGNCAQFKELRLEAIATTPQAFGISLADEKSRSSEFYQTLLEHSQKENDVWLVFAKHNQDYVGMAGAVHKAKQLSPQKHVVNLVNLYVKPKYRRQHVGTKLLQALLTKLERSECISQILAHATTTETAAVKLLETCGFEKCGELSNVIIIDGQSYNQYIMQKALKKLR